MLERGNAAIAKLSIRFVALGQVKFRAPAYFRSLPPVLSSEVPSTWTSFGYTGSSDREGRVEGYQRWDQLCRKSGQRLTLPF
jgi:hypothetical protein